MGKRGDSWLEEPGELRFRHIGEIAHERGADDQGAQAGDVRGLRDHSSLTIDIVESTVETEVLQVG